MLQNPAPVQHGGLNIPLSKTVLTAILSVVFWISLAHPTRRISAPDQTGDFILGNNDYPLVNIQKNYGRSLFSLGKSTISIAIFNSKLFLPIKFWGSRFLRQTGFVLEEFDVMLKPHQKQFSCFTF